MRTYCPSFLNILLINLGWSTVFPSPAKIFTVNFSQLQPLRPWRKTSFIQTSLNIHRRKFAISLLSFFLSSFHSLSLIFVKIGLYLSCLFLLSNMCWLIFLNFHLLQFSIENWAPSTYQLLLSLKSSDLPFVSVIFAWEPTSFSKIWHVFQYFQFSTFSNKFYMFLRHVV